MAVQAGTVSYSSRSGSSSIGGKGSHRKLISLSLSA